MTGKIHSIETFGTVDGPGIRYVVFFQGCPMRCQYCHNPDTWNISYGSEKTVFDILDDYEKYKPFLRKGGLTATGGEPLMQLDFLTELFEEAKNRGIHTCLDTSGIIFNGDNSELTAKFDRLIKSVDLIMLDIKHIDDEEHIKITSHSNKNILAFLQYLDRNSVPVWIRHVVVPGLTDKDEHLLKLGRFLSKFKNIEALDVLPYHNMGKVKYDNLSMHYPLADTPPASKDLVNKAKALIFEGLSSDRPYSYAHPQPMQ